MITPADIDTAIAALAERGIPAFEELVALLAHHITTERELKNKIADLRRKAARRSRGYGREEPEAPTLPAKARRPAITISSEEAKAP